MVKEEKEKEEDEEEDEEEEGEEDEEDELEGGLDHFKRLHLHRGVDDAVGF